MTATHVLEREQLLREPRSLVFAFFAEPSNLERITPKELSFHIVTQGPIAMKEGAIIDYRLRLFGVPFGWRTLIEVYEPDTRFVDRQLAGPYALWRHTHTFTDVPEGTLMTDRVEYALPLGPLGHLARTLFVQGQLERIFDHRRKVIGELFGT